MLSNHSTTFFWEICHDIVAKYLSWSRNAVPLRNVAEEISIAQRVYANALISAYRVDWRQFFGPFYVKSRTVKRDLTKGFFLFTVVPANHFFVSAWSKYKLSICFAPIHSVNTLSVMLVDDYNWSFSISQVPYLQLVSLFIVKRHCDLCWDAFAPRNGHISTSSWAWNIVFKLKNTVVHVDVPQCD